MDNQDTTPAIQSMETIMIILPEVGEIGVTEVATSVKNLVIYQMIAPKSNRSLSAEAEVEITEIRLLEEAKEDLNSSITTHQ